MIVETSTDDPSAAWIVVELGLLQPTAGGADADGFVAADDLLRFRQDVAGAAWFDDLVVSRVPQLKVTRGEASGVYYVGQPITFRALALDPAAGDLVSAAAVRDATGATVWRAVGERSVAASEGGIDAINFEFDVDPLPPGWYEAEIVVAGGRDAMGRGIVAAARRRSAFVVLSNLHASGQGRRAVRD